MSFELRGILSGILCGDCREDLSGVTVRLYRNRPDQPVIGLAVADPKVTLALLDDAGVEAKAASLIAQTETQEDGSFSFQLGADQNYDGGPFEIDIYCGTVRTANRRRRRQTRCNFRSRRCSPCGSRRRRVPHHAP